MRGPIRYLREEGALGWSYLYLITHPWVIVLELYRRAKWFVQRGQRGYSDRDLWSLYDYILLWLPDAIAELRKTKRGYPVGMTAGRWHEALLQMEDGLRTARIVSRMDYPEGEYKKYLKKADKGLDLFRKHFWSLWD